MRGMNVKIIIHTHKFIKFTDDVLFTPQHFFYRQAALGAAMMATSHVAATPGILGYPDQGPKLGTQYGKG